MRRHHRKQQGFSLLELLMVLAMVGILSAVGFSNYNNWRRTAVVNQTAQEFASRVRNEHFVAKRTNATRTITLNTSAGSYTLGGRTYTLPSTVRLSLAQGTTSTTISFYAPYGSTIQSNGTADPNLRSYVFTSTQNNSVNRTVNVVGGLGKVVVR